MSLADHRIALSFTSQDLTLTTEDILSYSVSNDMLQIADPFTFELRLSRFNWELVERDAEVAFNIDGSQVLSGFVDSRFIEGDVIKVAGRDRGGRLADESAPLVKFGGKGLKELAEELVGDLFDEVILDNTKNRRLIAGRGRKKSRIEIGIEIKGDTFKIDGILSGKEIRHKVNPGETKAQVLLDFLEQADLLAWSTADGKTLYIGAPDQEQGAGFDFFHCSPQSLNAQRCNVISRSYGEDFAEMYSKITVVGSGRGNSVNYGRNITRRRGIAESAFVFERPKELIIQDSDLRSAREAIDRANREMEERNAGGITLEIEVPGHGQVITPGAPPSIYHFDAPATFTDEEIGIKAQFFITRVDFKGSREAGTTTISMVPKGTPLQANG